MINNSPIIDAVFAEGKIVSYRRLLQAMLDAELIPVLYREYASKRDMKAILLLRHDVDSDLDAALNLAAIEFSMGIRSTYFLLPPGDYGMRSNYYGCIALGKVWHSKKLLAAARQLVAYGHEVGLHNDFMQLSRITGRPVVNHLIEEVTWFRSHGIPILGSASHGSEFVKKIRSVNYEIFKGCERRGQQVGRNVSDGSWDTTLHEIEMGELGLTYEAYFLPRDVVFSDSSKTVTLIGPNGYKQQNLTLRSDEDFQNISDLIKEVKDARCTVLVHPNWWVSR
jgi:hypothetical protein